MSHHHHEKKHKKLLQLFRNRHTLQVNQLGETLERGREIEREREEELRESMRDASRKPEKSAGAAGEGKSGNRQLDEIRNKNTHRSRVAQDRWNRFAGTEGGGGRGL